MKRSTPTRQSGYALILMVLALMGVGGIVIAGYTQEAKTDTEHQRYLHNERVLREAKQALLQYAYNYPVTNDLGPGRLPNADTDNDGVSDGGSSFGRLPWAQPNLNLYDIRDADGQRLWYAVSTSFRPQATVVNSDTSGTITLRDQTGNVIFYGSNPDSLTRYGVAAVIIAPGAVIDRNGAGQNRTVTNGDDPFDASPDTDPAIITASNYLDLVAGVEDNSGFTNSSDTDGLILGPVGDLTNDQFIVITAAEVAEMAEMATLQAYREVIRDYMNKVACSGETPEGSGTTQAICLANGGAWNPVYPWLYNYDGVEYNTGGETVDVAIDKLSGYFPAGACDDSLAYPPNTPAWHNQADCAANGGTWDTSFAAELEDYLGRDLSGTDDGVFGRIPSIFSEYFTAADSQPIESSLDAEIEVDLSGGLTYTQVTSNLPPDPDPQPPAQFQFNSGPTIFFQTQSIATYQFAADGTLSVNFLQAVPSVNLEMYFWDDDEGAATGFWTPCGDDGDNIPELSDCHRANIATPTPGGPHLTRLEILHVTATLDFSATPGPYSFGMDYATAPTIAYNPPTAGSHATITATFDGANVTYGALPTLSAVTYEYDPHYHDGMTFLGEQNPGAFTTGTINAGDFNFGDLTLTIRYYPELPTWTMDNEWHNSIRMAYALEYKPPGTGPCGVDTTCLHLNDSPGEPRNVASLLVIAGTHNWQDEDGNGRLKNDVDTVFDADPVLGGNHDDNPRFYRHSGNDKILVIEEL